MNMHNKYSCKVTSLLLSALLNTSQLQFVLVYTVSPYVCVIAP